MKNSSKHMKPAPNYLDLPYSREIKMPYTEYMIPTSIRPSIFPYFLHSPTTKQPQKPQIQALKPKPAKSNWRSKFIISLPNKAFKKKQVLFNHSTGLSSSLLAKLSEPLLEKHFKAFKKTVPLEKFSKQGEIQETIQRVLKHEENIHKESSFLCSAVPSFSPGLSNRKRTQTSPGRIKSKRDIFDKHGLNTSKISMKSSVNFDIKGIVTKDKDKAFLEIYLNSFEDSPEAIRMKTSRFSKSPLLAPPIQNKEVESPKQATSRTLRPPITNKGEIEKHEEEGEVDSKEKEGKKRNDHNLIKILLHYWKFEKKVSKNRPPPPKKNVVWNRKINFSNVKKHLLELLLFLAKINISLDEVYKYIYIRYINVLFIFFVENKFKNHKIFPDKPYEIEGSYIFLKSVKYGNLESVKAMVEKNKLYVLEYDYVIIVNIDIYIYIKIQ